MLKGLIVPVFTAHVLQARKGGASVLACAQRVLDLFVALFVDILERAEQQRDILAGSGDQWIFLVRITYRDNRYATIHNSFCNGNLDAGACLPRSAARPVQGDQDCQGRRRGRLGLHLC